MSQRTVKEWPDDHFLHPFNDMKKTVDPSVQNRLGALFLMVVSQIFSTMTAAFFLVLFVQLFRIKKTN